MVQQSPDIQSHFFITYGMNNTSNNQDRFLPVGRDIASTDRPSREITTTIEFFIRRVIAKCTFNGKGAGNTIVNVVVNGVKLTQGRLTIPAGDSSSFDSGEIIPPIRISANDLTTMGIDTTGQVSGAIQFLAHWECFVAQNRGNRGP